MNMSKYLQAWGLVSGLTALGLLLPVFVLGLFYKMGVLYYEFNTVIALTELVVAFVGMFGLLLRLAEVIRYWGEGEIKPMGKKNGHNWIILNGIDYCTTHDQEILCTGKKGELAGTGTW